jgi:adenylate cyclase
LDSLALALIGSAPSAVVALDTEGRVTMLNPPAEKLLDLQLEDALGRSYQDVFGASLADRLVGLFLRSSRSGESVLPQLVRASLPGGRRAELRASMGPIRDPQGRVVGFLFVADEQSVVRKTDEAQAELTNRLRRALRSYLGPSIAAMVENRPSFVGVGGVRRYVSLLHADVRGYTTLAESMEPEAVTTLLLRYHGRAVHALHAEGATLDRFIGDAVLAMWNAPDSCEQHARSAIRGALAVQAATQSEGEDLRYGIGVHTGDAVVGNVGTESFLNYTAVGDTVNVAARLQSEASPGEVICSDRALAEAGDGIRATPLGAISVKGRSRPVQAFRIDGLTREQVQR